MNQANGTLDELETSNYALDAASILSQYQLATTGQDSDGDGWPDAVELLLGSNPYDPNSRPDGITIVTPVDGSTISR